MLTPEDLKNNYLNWVKQKIKLSDLNGVIEITTPFLDRHNDHLQIYVIPQNNNKIKLTDDGYILSDLKMSGCDIHSSPKREAMFNTILNGFGVKCSQNDELYVEATIDNFPQKKNMLLQAMMAVNDMFFTAREKVSSIFLEDVEHFLLENEIRFVDNANFTGKSGFTHKFNFVIPASKYKPERFIQAMNNPTKQKAEVLLFQWDDIRETRKPGSTLYTFINDSEKSVSNELINALATYGVKPVLWKSRHQYIQELSA